MNNDLSIGKSLFMDLLRLFAAFFVMIMHVYSICFPAHSNKAYQYAHTAVVIFFVLSGFVIAFTTHVKNRGIKQYAIARLSRLYSVVLPALVLSILIELSLKLLKEDIYLTVHRGNLIFHYLASLIYINEAWFFSAAPPINAPLWSLSYEFSYYLLFGLFFFRKEIKYFPFFFILSVFIIGPKILLLMPIWLLGVLVFKIPPIKISTTTGISFSLFFFFLAVGVIYLVPSFPLLIGTPPLYFAAGFLTDLLIGICFALCLWFFPNKADFFRIGNKSYTIIRKLADMTFPIYILHYPLMYFYRAFFNFSTDSEISFFFLVTFIILFSVFLGNYLEKSRPVYIRIFTIAFDKLFKK